MTHNPPVPVEPNIEAFEMPIADIEIGPRYRKDMGDIDALADSIKQTGLLQPIVVTPNKTLIAGQRRIEAFKKLGRETIPVHR